MFRKEDGFTGQINYNERNNGISPHWCYVGDSYNYHIRVLIHRETISLDTIGVFCRIPFKPT